MEPGTLHVCYAHVQDLELGEEKLPKPSGRASNSIVLSPCQRLSLTWAHSGYRGNREAHVLPIPSAGLVTSQQTPSGKSGHLSATKGSNDPIWHHQFVSYNWLQWPQLTPSSGRFFQKKTDRWADHRDQPLVRTGTLECLAKPNPAAIPSNDLLLS